MSGSGCVIPGIFSDFHFDIQVGDNLFPSESIAAQGLQRLDLWFNRTVVLRSSRVLPFSVVLGMKMEVWMAE
jgi:hypothetical protein